MGATSAGNVTRVRSRSAQRYQAAHRERNPAGYRDTVMGFRLAKTLPRASHTAKRFVEEGAFVNITGRRERELVRRTKGCTIPSL